MSPARGSSMRQFRDMNPVPIGIVSIVVLIGMVVLSFNLTKLPFASGHTYSAAFSEAAGLRPGDQVQVGGVVVGKVSSVSLEGTHVKVDFRVTNSARPPRHADHRLDRDRDAARQQVPRPRPQGHRHCAVQR